MFYYKTSYFINITLILGIVLLQFIEIKIYICNYVIYSLNIYN